MDLFLGKLILEKNHIQLLLIVIYLFLKKIKYIKIYLFINFMITYIHIGFY